jgi:fimbrial chaperone protein
MTQIIKAGAAVLLLTGAAMTATAGEFSVTPVRIFMAPRDRAVAITVTNEGDQEVVMQADLYSWRQKPGGDEDLVLTEDMILSPPILKLAPKSRQVLRLARLTPTPVAAQVTYRMIVREIPEARAASKDPTVLVALAFSLPVFITPPGAKLKLDCKLERTAATSVNAICNNSGTAYAQPREFVLTSAGGEKLAVRDNGGYILPGITRTFELKREGKIPGGKVALQVALDDGSNQVFDTTLAD